MTGISYATREDVQEAADYKETARNGRRIDRALASASRSVEDLCHRLFYPHTETKLFDWPNGQYARPWRLWLDANDLISADVVSSGGVIVPPEVVLLEPNQYGPPFNQVQLDISTSSGWTGGFTHQRDISITGLWGYSDAEIATGSTTAALDETATTVPVDAATSADVGVGSLLRLDDERVTVSGRRQVDTGQTSGADLAEKTSAVTITVADGTQFTPGETILIDSERMFVADVAGDTLTVKRAWDGSPLAAHQLGVKVWAPRLLTVERGVCGTTAAAHAATAVYRWDPPALVRQLTIGEALLSAGLESSVYAQTVRSDTGGGQRTRDTGGISDLRTRTYNAHGRMARLRGV